MHSLLLKLPAKLLLHSLRFLLPRLNDLEKENLFLRYQLLILQRQISRTKITTENRNVLLVFTKLYDRWRDACALVQPETILKWHRQIAKMHWTHNLGGRPTIAPEIKTAMYRIKKENYLWGPAKIHGELIKLGISISESSVRNVLRNAPHFNNPSTKKLSWREFINRHKTVWAMDFFTVHSATFRTLHVLVIMNIRNREIISLRASDGMPTSEWVSNIIRNSVAESEQTPSLLIHDRDRKFRSYETQTVIKSCGIRSVQTPFRAPLANSFVERLNGTLQRECTDHFLFFNSRQLERTLQEYKEYYNHHRPHQGIHQKIPCPTRTFSSLNNIPSELIASELDSLQFLHGLHHSYFRKVA